jgi:hypothetical protein
MRLGMSGLNQHLFKFNIIDSYSCPHCINTTESPTHFLINCPQYAAERDRMFKAVLRVLCPNVYHSLLLPYCVDYLVNVMLRGSEDLSLLENQLIFDAIFNILLQQIDFEFMCVCVCVCVFVRARVGVCFLCMNVNNRVNICMYPCMCVICMYLSTLIHVCAY